MPSEVASFYQEEIFYQFHQMAFATKHVLVRKTPVKELIDVINKLVY